MYYAPNCFDWAYQASKITLEHNTPVILLSDGYLGNGAEPWKIKSTNDMPKINPNVAREEDNYFPYARDKKTFSRKIAIPGTKGLEHRLGGLEKEDITGNVSYDPENHEKMCKIRSEKINRLSNIIPEQKIYGKESGNLLVVGWGGTFGSLYSAVGALLKDDNSVGLCHFNYINPLPGNTKEILSKFKRIVVCELNAGQFANYLRMNFQGFVFEQYNKLQGFPFTSMELEAHFKSLLSK